ncbi:hypothetical protein P9762_15615, partial [Geobacillus stearothermophilus]|nr:hypothetical protein [Geobacillus stearothermophilus]
MKDDNRLSFWFLGACVERLSGECGESLLFFWQIERAQRCVMVGMIKTVTDFMNHFESSIDDGRNAWGDGPAIAGDVADSVHRFGAGGYGSNGDFGAGSACR